MSTTVSVVVPTLNGAATLPALFDALAAQQTDLPLEIVAVDSGSTDGTISLLRQRAHVVLSVNPRSFDHGLTRNAGIDAAQGDLIVLTVQDALPASTTWLEALTAPLRSDLRVAGSFARQTPRSDASPIARHYLAQWVASAPLSRLAAVSGPDELTSLSPAARLERCAFDNVCSCIRRTVWKAHPFCATPIGEDLAWAREVLLAGYRLAYAPAAEVIHSHDRSAWYELARTYLLHVRLHQLFGLRTIPRPPVLVRSVLSSFALHWRLQRNGRAVALALAWPLGQYLGGLTAARGWKPLRPRGV